MGLAPIETQAKLCPAIKQASSDHCIPVNAFSRGWRGVPSSTGLKLVAYGSRLTRPVNLCSFGIPRNSSRFPYFPFLALYFLYLFLGTSSE
eukprot:scaffold70292_cov87-Cyclotella_meneghiniana.AAC.6